LCSLCNLSCSSQRAESGVVPDILVILVVEDDQLVQSFVEETLSDGGFEPAVATSGEAAVVLLKGQKGKIPSACDRHPSARQNGWMGDRPVRPRNRTGISRGLYERSCRCRLGLERGSEQHNVVEALRPSFLPPSRTFSTVARRQGRLPPRI
jgi:CheY-like chemotaxis protein